MTACDPAGMAAVSSFELSRLLHVLHSSSIATVTVETRVSLTLSIVHSSQAIDSIYGQAKNYTGQVEFPNIAHLPRPQPGCLVEETINVRGQLETETRERKQPKDLENVSQCHRHTFAKSLR